MTTPQIHSTVNALKPVSYRQVLRYLETLQIKPLGIRQRPQQYPDDAADKILASLGLAVKAKAPAASVAPARLPSMRELKAAKHTAKGGRA